MNFMNPIVLWLLLLVLPIAVFLRFREQDYGKRFLLIERNVINPTSNRLKILRSLLWGASYSLCVIALARPVWGTQIEVVDIQGLSVMLVLDVSTSMDSQDILPSRLERAKVTLRELIQQLESNEVGLVIFAGQAIVHFPLTKDSRSSADFLNGISSASVPIQGTNVADALRLALLSLNSASTGQHVMILLTDGESHEGDLAAVRGGCLLVALVTQRFGEGGAAYRRDLVDCGDGMARANFAGIDAIVAEILAAERASLVTDQAIFGDTLGVELDLDLHVVGDREEGAADFVDQHAAGFGFAVDVSCDAVAVLGQALHQRVIVIAAAEAEYRQVNTGLALALDDVLQLLEIGDADVEIAVGGEDDAVDGVGIEVLFRQCVREFQALAAGRRAASMQAVERVANGALIVAARGLKHGASGPRIDDDGDVVLLRQLLGEHAEAIEGERELVGTIHRPGDIDQQNEVQRRAFVVLDVVTLQPDVDELAALRPRRRGDGNRCREWLFAAVGEGVVVVEIVDELFDPHRVLRRQSAVREEAADV